MSNLEKRYDLIAVMSVIMGQAEIFENTVEVGRTELKEGEDNNIRLAYCSLNFIKTISWLYYNNKQ